jgi:hypothetical protein
MYVVDKTPFYVMQQHNPNSSNFFFSFVALIFALFLSYNQRLWYNTSS